MALSSVKLPPKTGTERAKLLYGSYEKALFLSVATGLVIISHLWNNAFSMTEWRVAVASIAFLFTYLASIFFWFKMDNVSYDVKDK